MADDEKAGYVVRSEECDWAGFHPSDTGITVLSFVTSGTHDFVLELTPAGLASLETKLEELREARRAGRRPQ